LISENIVLVSHGATIGALHAALGYDFTYVGQATISIFEEVQYNSFTFKCVASSNKAHLSPSNSQNLRAY
jgi:broad specificity phosphatase PhoE